MPISKGSLSFAPIQSVNERILNGGGDDHMVSERIRSDALFPDSDAGWNFLERSTNRANFSVPLKYGPRSSKPLSLLLRVLLRRSAQNSNWPSDSRYPALTCSWHSGINVINDRLIGILRWQAHTASTFWGLTVSVKAILMSLWRSLKSSENAGKESEICLQFPSPNSETLIAMLNVTNKGNVNIVPNQVASCLAWLKLCPKGFLSGEIWK